jgi:hypothetical protein
MKYESYEDFKLKEKEYNLLKSERKAKAALLKRKIKDIKKAKKKISKTTKSIKLAVKKTKLRDIKGSTRAVKKAIGKPYKAEWGK